MQLICPNCDYPIDSNDVNIATDLAKCTHCDSIHKASQLVEERTEGALTAPPVGSAIEIHQGAGETVEFSLPRKGLQAGHFALGGFATFWLGFVAFWTWGASQGSIFFALFSIPFWLVGLFMAGTLINSIFERQTLRIGHDGLTVIKRRPFGPVEKTFGYSEIQSVEQKIIPKKSFKSISVTSAAMKGEVPLVPMIVSGAGNESFFENANEAERNWITKYLAAYVRKKRGTSFRQ